MDVVELKNSIQNKTLSDAFLVMQWQDCDLIAVQYVKAIAEFKGLSIRYVESLDECDNSSDEFFESNLDNTSLNVLKADKFQLHSADNISKYNNTIVICKSIDSGTESILKVTKSLVVINKLQDWQILDYIKVKCPGLGEAELKWLQQITGNNIHRLEFETDKISIFEKSLQPVIFNLINSDGGYSDLSQLTIFNFTNAIIKRDYSTIKEVLTDIDNIDIEGVGLVTILRKNILNIMSIQMNAKATPESTGMTPKQFNAVRYSCGKIKDNKLIEMLQFLNSIDYRLKSGNLTLSNSRMIDYILCNVL